MITKYKTLIVYFSRSGNTKKVVDQLSDMICCDAVETVGELTNRSGVLGYARSLWESLTSSAPIIEPPQNDPSRYDVVIVASPVWISRLASPMRTYLLKMQDKLPRLAFLVTEGGSGGNRVLLQMRELSRKSPLSEAVITEDEIRKGVHIQKIKKFVERLNAEYERAVAPVAIASRKVVS